VAIVGGSGSGKTTLVKILAGFFTESSGEIYYDGVNTQDIGLKQIRANSFLVLQSPQLFNNTLRYNLTYGEEIDEDTILKAIDIAELGDFIDSHKKGLDTMLGREGVSLSGGERQRVSIARMIVKNPKIIFLDESTSALDTVTESKLFAKLQTYLQDKTVVMIAHRINTIKSADFIYALEDGVLNLKNIEDL
ncbi:MAG TPA: ATP-binding cassette domain-containing protein, partial [Campylobacterales bacterium]|nr:ATP-binding cassette domain-containing protein [Campylobacterales bacterium]